MVQFGHEIRDSHFGFDPKVTNLNHGSYGATTKDIMAVKIQAIKKLMEYPDQFYRDLIYTEAREVRELMAERVNCEVDDLVFVTNATTGANAVLRSYPFAKGDVVVYFSTIYTACLNTLKFLRSYIGIELVEVPVAYPVLNQEILSRLKSVLAERKPKLVFTDAISSMPSALFPWQEIVEICRKNHVLSFVDGAHYLGVLPLDLKKTRPDFFVSNLHKWYFIPNSCAILYVDRKHHKSVLTLPISNFYAPESLDIGFAEQFSCVSTIDYSARLTIPAAIDFIDNVCGGEERLRTYMSALAKEAIGYILENWEGSELLTGDGDDVVTSMFNIKVPGFEGADEEVLSNVSSFLNTFLLKKKSFVPVFIHNHGLWTRWSVQIYLEIDDFKKGLACLKEGLAQFKNN